MSDQNRQESTEKEPQIACNVKGHDHELIVRKRLVQEGTGMVAWSLECPTGRYRFLHFPGKSAMPRYTRPHWGWKED
jgi:late competence protein required for DNA uptake (superfamily II DNA/RNA helicase)